MPALLSGAVHSASTVLRYSVCEIVGAIVQSAASTSSRVSPEVRMPATSPSAALTLASSTSCMRTSACLVASGVR